MTVHSLSQSLAFNFAQLAELESQITLIDAQIHQSPDLLDSKVQSLHRLKLQYLRSKILLERHLRKSTVKTKTPPAPEFPESWRTDPACFAREALHLELFDHQVQFCALRQRTALLIAGRGAGKSTAACVKALHQAGCRPRSTVLVVSSGQRMSTHFGAQVLTLVRQSPLRECVASLSHEQVVFQNGSEIKLLPANPDTIRGYHPKTTNGGGAMTIILDEACFMEQGDEIRKAVEYALITTPPDLGQLCIVSSPTSTASWVYEYVQRANQGDPEIGVIQCPSRANPRITAEELERLRATKNSLEYRAEVLGEWVDGAYGLFTGLLESNRIGPDAEPLPEDYLASLGADLALSFSPDHDRNALAVTASWPGPDGELRFRLVELVVLGHASDEELRRAVDVLREKHGLHTAIIEQYQGKALAEYCQSLGIETQLAAPTPGNQQMIFHELHRLLRERRLQLPDTLPDLFWEEMNAFEYRREADGRASFGHPPRAHDDTVYALAWSLHAALHLPPPPPNVKPYILFVPPG
ncbi:MAG: terminase large subunit domain-containing protein [bacterium]